MEKPSLVDQVTKWATVAVMLSGIGIGAFFLEARHSIQSDEIKQLIRAENELHSSAIAETVIQVLRKDLQTFRDSISNDHNRLMNANFEKDSLLLIVMPRMLEHTIEARNTANRIEATMKSSEQNDLQPIWEYLKQKESRDSIANHDAKIMRELRRINMILMHRAKFESDNRNNAGQLE